MNNLSLRSMGLLTLLKPRINQPAVSLQELSELTSDKEFFIENTLVELEKAQILRRTIMDNGTFTFELKLPMEGKKTASTDIQDRICGMFRYDRAHSLIAWFLDVTEAEYNLDESLRERVIEEYDAARVIQFWKDDMIKEAYQIVAQNQDRGMIRMEDILLVLEKRDRGI